MIINYKNHTPAQNDEQKAVEMQQKARNPRFRPQHGIFLQRDDEAEIEAPEDEIPARAVPHSRQEPDHQDVEELVGAVAAEGNVKIIAEEASQRDMPPAPEVRDGIAAVRMVEVLLEMEH